MEAAFKLVFIIFLFLFKLNSVYCTESSVLNSDENINANLFNEQSLTEKGKKSASSLTLNIPNNTSEYTVSCFKDENDMMENLNSILEKVNNIIKDSEEKKFSFELPKVKFKCFEEDDENNKTKTISKFEMICLEIDKIEKFLVELKNIVKCREKIAEELFICCNNLINNIQTIYPAVKEKEGNEQINLKSFDDLEKSLHTLTRIILIENRQTLKSLLKQTENASQMVSKVNKMCVKKINNTPTILESSKTQGNVLMDLNNAYYDLCNNSKIIVNKNWDEKCLVYQIRICNKNLSKWLENMEKEFVED